MCSAIRYEGIGDPLYIGYCHCSSCRHHTSSPVAAMLVFEADKVSFLAGKRSIYESSPGIGRSFCSKCGTSLTWEGHGLISLLIGTLDNPDDYPPTLHWRYEERSLWCDVASDLPKVKMVFPESSQA